MTLRHQLTLVTWFTVDHFSRLNLISIFTWHGHWLYWSLNWLTHDCSQVWSSLQSTMHWPRSILFSRLHRSRLSSFWGDLFWPQTQIGFGQPLQPSGQLVLHGQSENIMPQNFHSSIFYLRDNRSELFHSHWDSLYRSKPRYNRHNQVGIDLRILLRYLRLWNQIIGTR